MEGFWKTRDNGGKAAWLFIGVLSSVYWVSDVITDDELAVLIIRACSSRNLFVKHHFTSSHLLNNELNKRYAYLACCPRRGLRARHLARTQKLPKKCLSWDSSQIVAKRPPKNCMALGLMGCWTPLVMMLRHLGGRSVLLWQRGERREEVRVDTAAAVGRY